MPSYQERSQILKALSEQQYFDALSKRAKDKNKDVQIGSAKGDTGRYEVYNADGGISSNGVKTFNAASPSDGFVRGTRGGNSIALDHRNIRQKAFVVPQSQTVETISSLKTLFRIDSDLYIGADRVEPIIIYSFGADADPTSATFRIDATGTGDDDWIVTGFCLVFDSNLLPYTRYKYITITPDNTYEDYAGVLTYFQRVATGDWVVQQYFKVGDEVYLAAIVTDTTPKWYVRTVTPVIFGYLQGYTIAVSATPSGTILPPITGAVAIRLAKTTDSQLAGHGWLSDLFFRQIFNNLSVQGGSVEKGDFSLVSGKIYTAFGDVRDNDNIVFFKKTTSSILPTPLIENKIYQARNPRFSSGHTVFDVYDAGTPVTLSGTTSDGYVVKGGIGIPTSAFDYFTQSFTQIDVAAIDPAPPQPFYNCNAVGGITPTFNLYPDSTHPITNTGNYFYINSTNLGLVSDVYFVPDYTFLVQGANIASQLIVKTTVTKTDDPDNDLISFEYRLYTGDTFIVIENSIYPDYAYIVFNNLVGNKGLTYDNYVFAGDGTANIVIYEFDEGIVNKTSTTSSYFAIPTTAIVLWTSVYN
jgi:hypothetical protein